MGKETTEQGTEGKNYKKIELNFYSKENQRPLNGSIIRFGFWKLRCLHLQALYCLLGAYLTDYKLKLIDWELSGLNLKHELIRKKQIPLYGDRTPKIEVCEEFDFDRLFKY